MPLRRAEVESSFYQRSIQSRDHAGQQKHITCHQVTGSQNCCISYSCYTIKASCWFMGGKLLVWSGSSRKCWVCMRIIKLSWYLKEGTGTWEWNYTPNYRDSVRSYRSPASSPESILWRKRTNKTAYDSSSWWKLRLTWGRWRGGALCWPVLRPQRVHPVLPLQVQLPRLLFVLLACCGCNKYSTF